MKRFSQAPGGNLTAFCSASLLFKQAWAGVKGWISLQIKLQDWAGLRTIKSIDSNAGCTFQICISRKATFGQVTSGNFKTWPSSLLLGWYQSTSWSTLVPEPVYYWHFIRLFLIFLLLIVTHSILLGPKWALHDEQEYDKVPSTNRLWVTVGGNGGLLSV